MSIGKPRDRAKELFWRRMIAQRQKSGLSVQRFCELHDLSAQRFYAWQRVIQERDAQEVRFVPVEIMPEEKPVAALDGSAGALELVLSKERLLRIGTGFDADTLQRLLAVLEEGQPC
jgi:transposase-like protein